MTAKVFDVLLAVPKFGRVKGDARAQPVPYQPVEDGRRPVGAPARRARGAARAAPLSAMGVSRRPLLVAADRGLRPIGCRQGNAHPRAARADRGLQGRRLGDHAAATSGRGRRRALPASSTTRSSSAASTAASSWSTSRSPAGATARSRAEVDRLLESGSNVILELEVEGAFAIRRRRHDALLVFIAPPSFDDLERRLRARATEIAGDIEYAARDRTRAARERDQFDAVDRQRRRGTRHRRAIGYLDEVRSNSDEGDPMIHPPIDELLSAGRVEVRARHRRRQARAADQLVPPPARRGHVRHVRPAAWSSRAPRTT